MANHTSAKKRNRQNAEHRIRNRATKGDLRTTGKKIRAAVAAGDTALAATLMKEAERAMSKAANKGVIHRKNASRNISRLAKTVSAASKKK